MKAIYVQEPYMHECNVCMTTMHAKKMGTAQFAGPALHPFKGPASKAGKRAKFTLFHQFVSHVCRLCMSSIYA